MSSCIGETFSSLQGGEKSAFPSIKRKDRRNMLGKKITSQLLCFILAAECQGFAVIKMVKAQELVLTKN